MANKDSKISPKEFLRSRRPEKFSDSIELKENILDRSVLEHHIATLNKRNQELAFEDYAKTLCEKIVCPNLLAQTGPVAGGDGKVDTQTFPVSEQNKLMWYEGINESSDKERWAFAVSTQETWQAKCRNDISKIEKTERDYKKAFFITNQYAKSNQRSEIEDTLRKETGIDVRIFDISWLLDQTFKHGYEDVAIDTLSIKASSTTQLKPGPNDYKKNIRLDQIIDDIKNNIDLQNISFHDVDMFLEAAILSKEIENSLIETQGLFDRAVKTSEQFGTNQQKFEAYYQYAWASHWWFEDFSLLETNLEKAFKCITQSTNSSQWENLVTLINIFQSHMDFSGKQPAIDFESIKSRTKKQLKIIAEDDLRPTNSLQARTSLVLMDLVEIKNKDDARTLINELLAIANECGKLVGYPFDTLFNLVAEMDLIFGEMDEYEALIDYLTEQSSIRYGEIQSSRRLLDRGIKRLNSDKPYQTIKLVGKSLLGLYKNESRKDIVLALSALSSAYIKIGLPWAARANLLLAASLITDDYWRSEEINPAQTKSYFRLAWVEIQLGRIFHSLTWLQLALITNSNLKEPVIDDEDIVGFDAFLCHFILRTEINKIKKLEKLPDLLDELSLFNAREILLYYLGYEDIVANEAETEIDEDFVNYLKQIRDYDFGLKSPKMNIFTGRWNEIKSSVLGCNITISFPLRSPLVELAESILSVIEGFCSTGIVDKVFSIEPNLIIDISAEEDNKIAISHDIDDTGGKIVVNIMCSAFTPDMLNIDSQFEINNWLKDFIFDIYFKIMLPNDNAVESMKSLIVEDQALERSISFGACFRTLYNILGNNAINDISSLIENKKYRAYTLSRKKNWDSDFPIKETPIPTPFTSYKPGKGTAPDELTDFEKVSHSDLSIKGLIKPRLWDKVKWRGVAFMQYHNGPPILSLMFENEIAANSVFTNLIEELGSNDPSNRLRISIIRKISSKSPSNYRVLISENISNNNKKFFTMMSRKYEMTPSTEENLNRFLSEYKKAGCFELNYSIIKNGQLSPLGNPHDLNIIKNEIIIKDAWEIGLNDIDFFGISEEDLPIIPDGIKSPPVAEVLSKLKEQKKD